MGKKLFIIESPNKVPTIREILGNDYIIMSSVGHIRKINDSGLFNMGIDPDKDFEADYVKMPDKADIIDKLKEQVKIADHIYLATDPDREGEAIAWHLKEVLKIPASKCSRVTYHEITKRAITEALKNPGKIDNKMVSSATTRARLDKIVGYRLSPVASKKVGARSVGRCQSAALKILVEREEEIEKFNSKKYYELFLPFIENDNEYKAKYIGTALSKVNQFDSKEIPLEIVKECEDSRFILTNVETKERHVSPKAPFTTSTFQQEVSSKLGISVKQSMSLAQRLFEGINIGGKHIALITYIRTDSAEYAPEFIEELHSYIKHKFKPEYFNGVRKVKKNENAQNGHEAIRPVDLAMTPERLEDYIDDEQLLKVYKIIYNRAVASAMSDQIISDTEYTISNGKHNFLFVQRAIKFDGFKIVYTYKDDNEEDLTVALNMQLGYNINNKPVEIVEKATRPPKRYSEAHLTATLDKLGIGRPSTYATILSVLTDPKRNYCTWENKLLKPTELGIKLSHFLEEYFPDIISVDYTAEMENSLDDIAAGKLKDVEFLRSFYSKLDDAVSKIAPTASGVTNKKCPNCGKTLVYREGRFGPFLACPGYPKCKYTEKCN